MKHTQYKVKHNPHLIEVEHLNRIFLPFFFFSGVHTTKTKQEKLKIRLDYSQMYFGGEVGMLKEECIMKKIKD